MIRLHMSTWRTVSILYSSRQCKQRDFGLGHPCSVDFEVRPQRTSLQYLAGETRDRRAFLVHARLICTATEHLLFDFHLHGFFGYNSIFGPGAQMGFNQPALSIYTQWERSQRATGVNHCTAGVPKGWLPGFPRTARLMPFEKELEGDRVESKK
jgi:hypothetical protein